MLCLSCQTKMCALSKKFCDDYATQHRQYWPRVWNARDTAKFRSPLTVRQKSQFVKKGNGKEYVRRKTSFCHWTKKDPRYQNCADVPVSYFPSTKPRADVLPQTHTWRSKIFLCFGQSGANSSARWEELDERVYSCTKNKSCCEQAVAALLWNGGRSSRRTWKVRSFLLAFPENCHLLISLAYLDFGPRLTHGDKKTGPSTADVPRNRSRSTKWRQHG